MQTQMVHHLGQLLGFLVALVFSHLVYFINGSAIVMLANIIVFGGFFILIGQQIQTVLTWAPFDKDYEPIL